MRVRLYAVIVEIFESFDYPVVTHTFLGRTRHEAWSYHDAHLRTDSFLRACEDKRPNRFIDCYAKIKEGWQS